MENNKTNNEVENLNVESYLRWSEENDDLIVAAVNSCKQINPSNPIAAANAYGEVLEALIHLSAFMEQNNFTHMVFYKFAQEAIEKATKQ